MVCQENLEIGRGKGVHARVDRLQTFIRRVSANGTRCFRSNYFASIDKQPCIADDETLWLTRLLVFHDCTQEYFPQGDPAAIRPPAAPQDAFSAPGRAGLAIGNLNSQFFANVYLNTLDQFVKHELSAAITCAIATISCCWRKSRTAPRMAERIRTFLRRGCGWNSNDARGPAAGDERRGGFFLAATSCARRLPAGAAAGGGQLPRALAACERELVRSGSHGNPVPFDPETVDRLVATVASYLTLRPGQCPAPVPGPSGGAFLPGEYVTVDRNCHHVRPRLLKRRDFRRVAQQYRHFREQFPQDGGADAGSVLRVLFSPAGGSPGAALGIKALGPTRRGARHGFPADQLARRLASLLAAGIRPCWCGRAATRLVVCGSGVPARRWVPRPAMPGWPGGRLPRSSPAC